MAELDRMTITFRQALQKSVEAGGILFQERRQLPEDRADAFFERLEPAEMFSEAAGHRPDLFYVSDEPAALYGKHKSLRRFVAPAPDHLQRRQPVEGGVDLHG